MLQRDINTYFKTFAYGMESVDLKFIDDENALKRKKYIHTVENSNFYASKRSTKIKNVLLFYSFQKVNQVFHFKIFTLYVLC